MAAYGPQFARLYATHWNNWTHRTWPLIERIVARDAPAATAWLDLCCGAGALLRIVEPKYGAVGVDSSRYQLAEARRVLRRATLKHADVRNVRLRRRFDIVTCLFDSMNYLLTPADFLRALTTARVHLNPRAVFIFDVNTITGFSDRYRATYAIETDDQFATIISSFSPSRRRGVTQVVGFVKHRRAWRRYDEAHDQRAYDRNEIEQLLQRAKLDFRVYDGDRLSRPRRKSGRLMFICTHAKPSG